jgi:hypothetical protein
LDEKKEIGMNGYLLAPFEKEDDITQAIKLLEGASLLVLFTLTLRLLGKEDQNLLQ